MENNFSEELINEMSRNMCFYADSCTEKSCYKANCEKTWLAKRLLRQGWHKQIEARWKREEIYDSSDAYSYIVKYTCSNCLEKQKVNTRYCPVCGAKMGGAI